MKVRDEASEVTQQKSNIPEWKKTVFLNGHYFQVQRDGGSQTGGRGCGPSMGSYKNLFARSTQSSYHAGRGLLQKRHGQNK